MKPLTTRREFCAISALALLGGARSSGARDELRVGIIVPAGVARSAAIVATLRGVELGLDEAAKTARLFRQELSAQRIELTNDTAVRDAASRAVRAHAAGGAGVLLLALRHEAARAAAADAGSAGIPCIQLLEPVTGTHPGTWEFSVAPARDALTGAVRDAGDAAAEAWLPTLFRYGAAQLNDRFRARFGAEAAMDGAAWCGWFAVKAATEAWLRARSREPAAIRDALRALRFDGHKGTPLAFAPDGNLPQPLYTRGEHP